MFNFDGDDVNAPPAVPAEPAVIDDGITIGELTQSASELLEELRERLRAMPIRATTAAVLEETLFSETATNRVAGALARLRQTNR